MQHKIEVCIMNQDKIKKKSKYLIYDPYIFMGIVQEIHDLFGYKKEDHDLIRSAYQNELIKVQKELNLHMIRHEIYEKELEKQKLKMAKEAEEEAKRIQEEKIAEVERIKRE